MANTHRKQMAETHFLTLTMIYFYIEKHRGEGQQDAITNGTNQASQKTQRGEWDMQTYTQRMRNKSSNPNA